MSCRVCFNFDACQMHPPFGFVHLPHQKSEKNKNKKTKKNPRNSLAKVNTQLLIYIKSACQGIQYCFLISVNQGNLKREPVTAAILLSRMEVSYCTSGFVRREARQAISLRVCCLSRLDLNHVRI